MRYPGLLHAARWHCCHRLFLSSVACEIAVQERPQGASAVKAAVRRNGCRSARSAREGLGHVDGIETSSQV